jgi:fibrillarin-like pre-rRNA processing protein
MEKVKLKEIFNNIYELKSEDGLKRIATKSLVPSKRIYGEKLITGEDNLEYRIWNPNRSKLGAAIVNGLEIMPIKKGSKVLYLGVSAGTTPSHVADITENSPVYSVEFAPRIMREFLDVSKDRKNLFPILGDATNPVEYSNTVEEVDVIFEDVAQPKQAEILVNNAKWFLKDGGYGMISIKARSVDVLRNPKEIFEEQKQILIDGGFEIVDEVNIEPFEKDHILFVGIWNKQ